ncbi:MAG: UbiA-like polyprenyltransferase, partial [Candidatus Hydrothermarchaeaceae archaeon]
MPFAKIKILLEMIKIEHTIFAMPFLYSGAILAAGGIPSAHVLIWITVGIVSARTAAMGLNRLIDRDIDAKNPRTRGRALPAGRVSGVEVKALVAVSLGVLLIAAVMLNWLCVALYPLAVALFVIYPYLKRYTWLSHVVLGMTLGIAPLGAWAAVAGSLAVVPVLLFLAVTFWVAGFDVIYSYQDLEFDRRFGL